MNATAKSETVKRLAQLALGAVFAGLALVAVTVAMSSQIGQDGLTLAFLTFLGCQSAGLVLGIIARREAMGKAAAIISALVLVASLAVLG